MAGSRAVAALLLIFIVVGSHAAEIVLDGTHSTRHSRGADGVSVVVVGDVASNAAFFLAALRSIGAQELPSSSHNIEVIIVDTGAVSGAGAVSMPESGTPFFDTPARGANAHPAIASHLEVKYTHFSYASWSSALLEGCRLASGSVIAVWDVFASYAPSRLLLQVTPILKEEVRTHV